jgi:sugar lactone lactonase YvrE
MYYYDQTYSHPDQYEPALVQIGIRGTNERQLPVGPQLAEGTDLVVAGLSGSEKLYFTSPQDGAVYRAELDGRNLQVAASVGGVPSALAVNNTGTEFYWADMSAGALYKINSDGSSRQTLAEGISDLAYLLLDDNTGWLYWTEDRTTTGTIRRVRNNGLEIQTLLTDLHSPKGIALDSQTETLYWGSEGTTVYPVVTESSKLYRASIDDPQPEVFLVLPDYEHSDRFYHYYYPSRPRDLLFDADRGRLWWSELAGGRIFSVDVNAQNEEYLYAHATRMSLLSSSRAVCGDAIDYSGDRRADYVVWRPYHIDPILPSLDRVGLWFGAGEYSPEHQYYLFSLWGYQWGLPGDSPLDVDFDTDGIFDLTVWRPSNGTWYTCPSAYPFCGCSDYYGTCHDPIVQQFGLPGDYPLAGDFDDDGVSDYIVWRPSTGMWFILKSYDYTVVAIQWGLPGDLPLIGDYDGDGNADLAVWRPTTGTWYILQSKKNYSSAPGDSFTVQWGLPGDHPMRGDFDGDGALDLAVWRPVEGNWYLCLSSIGFDRTQALIEQFGLPDDMPIQADFDGDRISDFVVWRPQLGTIIGNWYVKTSGSGEISEKQFGLPSDIPSGLGIRSRVWLLYNQ